MNRTSWEESGRSTPFVFGAKKIQEKAGVRIPQEAGNYSILDA
jgi:hypothetical protein